MMKNNCQEEIPRFHLPTELNKHFQTEEEKRTFSDAFLQSYLAHNIELSSLLNQVKHLEERLMWSLLQFLSQPETQEQISGSRSDGHLPKWINLHISHEFTKILTSIIGCISSQQ